MASFSRKSGIVGALVIAGVLMVGAYVISGPSLSFFTPVANAESTQQLLQEYAAKLNSQGVPEWMAALGDATPKFTTATDTASSTYDSGLAGTPAAPGTLTDEFAQQFFGQYLQEQAANTSGTPPSTDDINTYAQSAMQTFIAAQSHPDLFSASQVKISTEAPTQALVDYAVSADKVYAANKVSTTESELDYFSDVVEKNNITALPHLAAIGKAYTAYANGFIQIPVPAEAATAQLEVVNAMANLGIDITDMSMEQTDPLRAYLGLQQYETDGPALVKSLSDMGMVYVNGGVSIPQNASGFSFYQDSLAAAVTELEGSTSPENTSQ